jgi:hydrogenase expression/formation protein HypD
MAKRILKRLGGMGLHHRFMHICGTHQDTLIRFGLEEMLRDVGVEIRQGPGCPVCVTTTAEIVEAMTLAQNGVTLAVFGDMLKVPTVKGSLADTRSRGTDIRVVYSIEDAIKLATDGREVVFMAIGFETTIPTTAMPLLEGVPESFSVYSCHRIIPPALESIFQMGEMRIDGFIQPGHVATIIGMDPFRVFSERYGVPQVISGFEPLDLLMSVYMLAKQLVEGRSEVENEYARVVRTEGNVRALSAMEEVFSPVDREWRGFPVIKGSGLELGKDFEEQNAKLKYQDILSSLSPVNEEIKGCRCGEVLRGIIDSKECPAFGKACTPMSPMGPCMVSREGSCNIAYRYHRER